MPRSREPLSQSPLRSLLFVPGTRPDLFDKARGAGADALVLDLEDSVPASQREPARANIAAMLAADPDRLTLVRINHPRAGSLERDLSVLAPHPFQALMIPKVQAAAECVELDERLTDFERGRGLAPYTIGLMIVIESALGLRNFYDTASSTRRIRAAGLASAAEGDLLVDLGAQWAPDNDALAYARGKFVCDGRAAGVFLYDGPFVGLQDESGLQRDCQRARRLGFDGKVAIHPRQLSAIHEAFDISAEQIAQARRTLAALREAEARGIGAVELDGRMIDYANARRAERILRQAGAQLTPDPSSERVTRGDATRKKTSPAGRQGSS